MADHEPIYQPEDPGEEGQGTPDEHRKSHLKGYICLY